MVNMGTIPSDMDDFMSQSDLIVYHAYRKLSQIVTQARASIQPSTSSEQDIWVSFRCQSHLIGPHLPELVWY